MPKTKKKPPEVVFVRLALDPEDHRQLRIVAAAAGRPMAVIAREAVLAAIRAAKINLD